LVELRGGAASFTVQKTQRQASKAPSGYTSSQHCEKLQSYKNNAIFKDENKKKFQSFTPVILSTLLGKHN
jgi:hypothetical protein